MLPSRYCKTCVFATTLASVDAKLVILEINDRDFGEWVEAEVVVDGERCLPFQFTKRVWYEIQNSEEKVFQFLYSFGRSMNAKCGTYRNPLPQGAVEEAAA